MSVQHHYVKLFSNIVHSTIWDADAETSKIWVTMLAISGPEGEVIMTIPGLARLARVSVETCESALESFQQPDKYSWTKENDGRRIQAIEGGWQLLNYIKYRTMLSEADRKAKANIRWKRWYERKKANAVPNETNVSQTDTNARKPQVEVDVEVDVINQKHSARKARTAHFSIPSLGEVTAYCEERKNVVDPQQWFNFYTSNGWKVGKNSMKDWRASVRYWETNGYGQAGKNGNLHLSNADPGCARCYGSGYRASYSKPGKKEPCECTEYNFQ